MGEAGLAEVHLGVDDSGEDVEPLGLEALRRGSGGEVAEGGDAAARDTHVGAVPSLRPDARPAHHHEVEALGQDSSSRRTAFD